jgi:hypothetical protein
MATARRKGNPRVEPERANLGRFARQQADALAWQLVQKIRVHENFNLKNFFMLSFVSHTSTTRTLQPRPRTLLTARSRTQSTRPRRHIHC